MAIEMKTCEIDDYGIVASLTVNGVETEVTRAGCVWTITADKQEWSVASGTPVSPILAEITHAVVNHVRDNHDKLMSEYYARRAEQKRIRQSVLDRLSGTETSEESNSGETLEVAVSG